METGKKYKLTDKCITPGGRNMTRDEDAIIEAKKYYRNDIKCYDAFLHGVEWVEEQIANVWHDTSEEPIMGARVLINHHLIVITWHNEYKWDACCKLFGITKWAYITDLLPKQFGNSEQLKGAEN